MTPMNEETKKQGKSFFDMSDKEKKEIVDKAAKEANRMQRELMEKATIEDPMATKSQTSLPIQDNGNEETWEERFKEEFWDLVIEEPFAFKKIIFFIRSELALQQKKDMEWVKKAFYQEFSGTGELWFPYSTESDPMTKEEMNEAVDPYWEDIVDFISEQRVALKKGGV